MLITLIFAYKVGPAANVRLVLDIATDFTIWDRDILYSRGAGKDRCQPRCIYRGIIPNILLLQYIMQYIPSIRSTWSSSEVQTCVWGALRNREVHNWPRSTQQPSSRRGTIVWIFDRTVCETEGLIPHTWREMPTHWMSSTSATSETSIEIIKIMTGRFRWLYKYKLYLIISVYPSWLRPHGFTYWDKFTDKIDAPTCIVIATMMNSVIMREVKDMMTMWMKSESKRRSAPNIITPPW